MKRRPAIWRLIRLCLRRDRWTLPTTISLILFIVVGSAATLIVTYGNQESIASYAAAAATSAIGRIFQGAIQDASIGSILVAEIFLTGAVILGIVSIFTVSRHSRHNEETGTAELICARNVRKSDLLTAALIIAIGTNLLIGLFIFSGLALMDEFDSAGSAYFAGALSAFGILMAAISALAVQLSAYRRGANIIALGVLGVFFLIRGLGDAFGQVAADGLSATSHWLSLLSPMGWSLQVLPFGANRLWPILALLTLSSLLIAGSYYLSGRRDLDSGIIAIRTGRAEARSSLLSPAGLAWRLQKTNLIAWLIGASIVGALTAIVINDYRQTLTENEVFANWITADGTLAIATILAVMLPLVIALLSGYSVAAITKMQDEEISGRLEHLLATGISKTKWFLSHLWAICTGNLLILVAVGIAGSLGYFLAFGSDQEIGSLDLLWSALANLPALILFTTLICLVFALRNNMTKVLAWAFYGYCTLIGSLTGIFGWPQWVQSFSPFSHSPLYPAPQGFDWLPALIMSGLATIILISSLVIFTKRDLLCR